MTYRRTFSQSTLKEQTKGKRVRKNYLFPETQNALPRRGFPDSFVFTHGDRKTRHYSHDYLNDLFRDSLAKLNGQRASQGLTELNLTLYEATKHSFATNHYQGGITLDTLKAHFGHSKRETTLIYTKLDPVAAFRKVTRLVDFSKAAVGDGLVTRKSGLNA